MRRGGLDGRRLRSARTAHKERATVAHAEGFQRFDLVSEPLGELPFDLPADDEGRDEVFARVVRLDIAVEIALQGLEAVGAHVDARRLRMPAEFFDLGRTASQSLEDVDRLDAPCRAPQHIAATDEEERGAGEFLHDARRHDADEPGMPVLALRHDDALIGALRRDLRARPLVELVAQPLTLGIVVVEKFCKDARLLLVLRSEEAERRVGVPHPARRVDAGREREGKRLRRHFLRLVQKRRKGGAGAASDEL